MEELKQDEIVGKEKQSNYVFLIPLLMGLTLAAGIWLGTMFIPTGGNSQQVIDDGSNKFNTILGMIEARYVDTVNHEELIESSIEGVIKKLDPHSAYIPAKDLVRVNEQLEGKFGGVGIRFLIHDDSLVATDVLEDSPSIRAGMLPGDRLIQVDGENITGPEVTNQKVMTMLKGLEGTEVKVKVFRNGETKDLSIVRGSIPVSSIDVAIMLDDEVGFIKLNSFTKMAGYEFQEAANKLLQQGMKKLIFDLRNNGGGYMSEATEIADHFLKSGNLIVYTAGRMSKREEYYSSDRGILENVEVTILINSLSASASEIVAGAIQDNDRGMIMGRRSFGKGLVQDQQNLKDGSALRLTISRYYTPTGRSIQKPYGEGVNYENDYYDRIEHGELLNEDSVKVNEKLKYTTKGGRTVYGGGGIYPDIFIPNDTAGASYYLTELYYNGVFNHYAINYLDKNRTKFKDFEDFNRRYVVSQSMFDRFIKYAEKYKVEKKPSDIEISNSVIRNRMKAEIARHLWRESGYYAVYLEDDLDVQEALNSFRK